MLADISSSSSFFLSVCAMLSRFSNHPLNFSLFFIYSLFFWLLLFLFDFFYFIIV